MDGSLFIANGDVTQLSADAIGFSAATNLASNGHLYPAFVEHVPGFEDLYQRLPRPCRVGDAFWLPLPHERRPRGVVVVAAAGGGRTLRREEKTRRAVEGALRVATAELRQRYPEQKRFLVALPTFRLGMGGDRNTRLESARVQLQTAHEFLHDHPDIDVAFVPYTLDSYRIFLQARRDLGLAPPDPLEPSAFAPLLDALRQRRCVLFVGAGASAGAGLPSWKALMEHLATDLGVPFTGQDSHDFYLDLAQWYVEEKGREALGRAVGRLFDDAGARPTLAHYLLTSLPVRVILTTNYDDLLERALVALRRHPTTVVAQADVVHTSRPDGVSVVKLHGDAVREEGIVLTRDDYDAFFRRRPATALLLEGLLLNQTFLFVGYSLRDPNFRQVYSRIADMLQGAKREAFALAVDVSNPTTALAARQWKQKGLRLLVMPGESMAERVGASLRFLDRLADRLASEEPALFLARDVPADGSLGVLRQTLMEEVGREVLEGCARLDSATEARHLMAVLAFLTDHGWRPPADGGCPLWRLWEQLARAVEEPAEQRRLLVEALRHTERLDHARRIREQLARLEGA